MIECLNKAAIEASPDFTIAVCGKYVPTNGFDAVHVGLFINANGEKKVIHFVSDNNILYNDIAEKKFDDYHFVVLKGFNKLLFYSLVPMLKAISQNKLIKLNLSIESIFYINGKFELKGNHVISNPLEKYINCALFVLTILNTYRYFLLDINSWPNLKSTDLNKYLDDWLLSNKIDASEYPKYYSYIKGVRGKHVLISGLASVRPVQYSEAEELSDHLIKFLTTC